MDAGLVDLTLTDSEEDIDTDLLSLQERIKLLEERKEKKNATKLIPPLPAGKRAFSCLDDENNSLLKASQRDEVKLPHYASNGEDDCSNHVEFFPYGSSTFDNKLNHAAPVSINSNGEDSDDSLPDLADILNIPRTLNVPKTVEPTDSAEEIKRPSKLPKIVKKNLTKQSLDVDKEVAKQEKLRLREEKRKEKELAKALKASEKELQKSKKPDECLKGMKIILDQSIIFEASSEDIFCALDEAHLTYNIEENPINLSVIWCRTVVNVSINNNQVVKEEREELENVLVLVITNENFIKLVHSFVQKSKGKYEDHPSLLDHITNIKAVYPHMDITCVTVGLEKYQRCLKDSETCSNELKKMAKQVSKASIEEATTEVQIQAFVNFNFLNTMQEFGDLLARFSKAIAEAPQRKEKHMQKCLAFSWYADADSSCPVKIGKDGSGFVKLWQQQIQQFNSVGPEVAEAIVSRYPSPQILLKAYRECSSTKEAEKLLQDIVVRRNYGPLGTQRRIGPELSYKIYLFYSSRSGDQVLQR